MAMLARKLPIELLQIVRLETRLARSYATTSTDLEQRDIVIVGGGVAGLALAASLCSVPRIRSTCSIALVEGSDLSRLKAWSPSPDRYENRVSSITADNKRILDRIGAWQNVDTARTQGIASMEVWDGLSNARISFDAQDAAGQTEVEQQAEPTAMAWLTENANLQRALMHTLAQSEAVELISPTRVEDISAGEGGRPVLSLSNGRQLQPSLLIGADGFNSPVRSYAQIDSMGWAYDTHAVVATMNVAPTLDNTTAFQRFLPTGPIAYLPLSDTVASLVWSTKPALAKALKALQPETLTAFINAAFSLPYASLAHLHNLLLEGLSDEALLDELRYRSSRAVLNPDQMDRTGLPPAILDIQPGTTASFPLRLAHADAYVSTSRVALLGDAAHTVHPLAGQGLNLGLGDVAALTSTIDAAIEAGGDIGSLTSLQPYARARWFPNHSILAAVDKLHKLYSFEAAPVVWARSAGLEVVNELGILKAAIMGRAGAAGTERAQAGGDGGPEAAARQMWSTVASGIELAQTAATMARPLAAGLAARVLNNLRK